MGVSSHGLFEWDRLAPSGRFGRCARGVEVAGVAPHDGGPRQQIPLQRHQRRHFRCGAVCHAAVRLRPHRKRYLTKDELPRLLRALDKEEDRLSVAALHVVPKGEVLSLTWNNVRLDEDSIYLPLTKNGRS